MSSSKLSSPSFLSSGTSRRSFLRYAGLSAAAIPIMTEGRLAWAAQQQVRGKRQRPATDANGNPPVMLMRTHSGHVSRRSRPSTPAH